MRKVSRATWATIAAFVVMLGVAAGVAMYLGDEESAGGFYEAD